MGFFSRKKKEKEEAERYKPIERGPAYFVEGENVQFKLNGMPFTFNKFYLTLTDEQLVFKVVEEAPMNLINIADTVELDIDLNRSEVMEADEVSLTLKLKPALFSELKEEIFMSPAPDTLFYMGHGGTEPLLDLSNWMLVQYGTSATMPP